MIKLLIAEDNDDLLMILKVRLEAAGFHVESATNGQEALKKIEEFSPDLVCLDIIMPVMDGLKVVQALRGAEKTKHLPVVLVSGSVEALEDIKKNLMDLGVQGYLIKPYEFQNLVQTIHRVLGR